MQRKHSEVFIDTIIVIHHHGWQITAPGPVTEPGIKWGLGTFLDFAYTDLGRKWGEWPGSGKGESLGKGSFQLSRSLRISCSHLPPLAGGAVSAF